MPKPRDEQRQRDVAPRRCGQGGHDIDDAQAALRLARREQGKGQQQQGFAGDGEGHIDAARAFRIA